MGTERVNSLVVNLGKFSILSLGEIDRHPPSM